MPSKIVPGSVILLPGTGPRGDDSRAHRCVIVADDAEKNDFLAIPICSHREKCDETVVLADTQAKTTTNVQLINRKSYASYYDGKKLPKIGLLRKIDANEIQYWGEVSTALLERIKKGVGTSPDTEPWFKERFDPVYPPKKGKVWGA